MANRSCAGGGSVGRAGGGPEREAHGRRGAGAEDGIRRAGGDREAVDDPCLANEEQQK